MKVIKFQTIIKKFAQNGEKTGWSYIEIPQELAEELNPGVKKSFRVKGKLDSMEVSDLSLLPMGGGDFILAINGDLRRGLKKSAGAQLQVQLKVDASTQSLSDDFITCLDDEPKAKEFFASLTGSHQRYFSKWIESAKTESTKVKRITMAIKALAQKQGYSEMIRSNKKSD